jgi:signal transduction histidine kinase
MIRRIVSLETRMEIQIIDGPTIEIAADGSQLEQALINLIRNAVESTLETQGDVTVSWRVQASTHRKTAPAEPDAATTEPNTKTLSQVIRPSDLQGSFEHLELMIDDQGPGIANRQNLFVPFYTTKPEGSGIGLVLSRCIAEAHGGTLTLESRADGPGCRATLRLPFHIRDGASQERD